MRPRISPALFLALVLLPFAAWGQEAGMDLSVFVPRSLIELGEGSPAFEQGFSTSLSFKGGLEMPLGFVYHGVDGWSLDGRSAAFTDAAGPSLYGDLIMPYAGLGYTIGIGPLRLGVRAGGAASYAFRLEAAGQAIEKGLAGASDHVAIESLEIGRKIGTGYFLGGEVGLDLGSFGLRVGLDWRHLRQPAPLSGRLWWVSTGSSEDFSLPNAVATLEGVAIRIGGSAKLK